MSKPKFVPMLDRLTLEQRQKLRRRMITLRQRFAERMAHRDCFLAWQEEMRAK